MTVLPEGIDAIAETEAQNIALVRSFFADWSQRDAKVLSSYLADDFCYQMIEGEPELVGPEKFIELLGNVLPTFESIDMEIRRIAAFAQLVIVDRYDRMIGIDEAHSMSFEVTASLVVYDGKIAALRDYPIRGGVFELGDSFR